MMLELISINLRRNLKYIYFISIINGHRDKAWFKKIKNLKKRVLNVITHLF